MYDASYRPGVAALMEQSSSASAGAAPHRQSFLQPSPPAGYDMNTSQLPQFSRGHHDDQLLDECSDMGSEDFVARYPSNCHHDIRGGSSGGSAGVFDSFTGSVVGAVGLGGNLIETGKRIFYHQRKCVQMGEGPTLLRLLCFLGGFAMLVSSLLSMINIFSLLTGPSTYVLQMYQGFFGIITMVVEAKDWDCLDQFKPWMIEWFRFLTVPAGKGAFYILVGSLGVSLWVRNLLAFTVGLYMATMGLVCVAVHAGTSRKVHHLHQHHQLSSAVGPAGGVSPADANDAGFLALHPNGIIVDDNDDDDECRVGGGYNYHHPERLLSAHNTTSGHAGDYPSSLHHQHGAGSAVGVGGEDLMDYRYPHDLRKEMTTTSSGTAAGIPFNAQQGKIQDTNSMKGSGSRYTSSSSTHAPIY